MILISPTSERVRANTPAMVNDHIRRAVEINVHYYKDHPNEITPRLWELDREWDVERALQAWTAGLSLVLLFLGWWSDWFLFFLFVVQGFALVHALHGWSPSLILLRYLHFRTIVEIEAERAMLKPMQPVPAVAPTPVTPEGSNAGMDENEEHPWHLGAVVDHGATVTSGGSKGSESPTTAVAAASSAEAGPPVAAVSSGGGGSAGEAGASPPAPTTPATSGSPVNSGGEAGSSPAPPSAPPAKDAGAAI